MSSTLFDGVAEALEEQTSLNRLEARGTLRLALKQAGLEPSSATAKEIEVVVRKLMPEELRGRGVEQVEAVCEALVERARSLVGEEPAGVERPEDVFGRFGA